MKTNSMLFLMVMSLAFLHLFSITVRAGDYGGIFDVCDISPPETYAPSKPKTQKNFKTRLKCIPGKCMPESCKNITVSFTAEDKIDACSDLDIIVTGAINGESKCSFSQTRCFTPGGYSVSATSRDMSCNQDSSPAIWNISVEPPAGCDGCPDENESVASLVNPIPQTSGNPAVFAVIDTGYSDDVIGLFLRFSENVDAVEFPTSSLQQLKKYSALIIPSGGLSGYSTSPLVKTLLTDYVQQGGILFSFSQGIGKEFLVLPGGEVSAAGYLEDISCYNAGSILDQYHPLLAGQKDATFDGGIDGYFFTWPKDSKILLRRKKNNAPALVVYPYGQGFVVASTLYTDYAGSTGQLTQDEFLLLKDFISWAKNPRADFMETVSQQQATLSLQLRNTTIQDADSVTFFVKDGTNQIISEETVMLSVPAGQTVSYDYTFMAPAILGNYNIFYTLLFGSTTIQPQVNTTTFSVTQHIESSTPDPELQFFITTPGNLFLLNSPIPVTIRIRNNGTSDKTLQLGYSRHGGGEQIGTFTIPAQDEVIIPYTSSNLYFFDYHVFHAWRWEFYLQVLSVTDNRWLVSGWRREYGIDGLSFTPSVTPTLSLDKTSYGPSSSGTTTLNLFNGTSGSFATALNVFILSPTNQKIFEATKELSFSANEEKTETVPFTLPENLSPGSYTVQAVVYYEGKELSRTARYFTVESPRVAVVPVLPQPLVPSSLNAISFNVENTGPFTINSGTLQIALKDSQGTSMVSDSQSFTLLPGEQKTLTFNVSFPALSFDTYQLVYVTNMDASPGPSGSIPLPNTITSNLEFDKASYKARETVNASLRLQNTGKFMQQVRVKTQASVANFTKEEAITLAPLEVKQIPYMFLIPDTASSGSKDVVVSLKMTNEITRLYPFNILDPKIQLSLSTFSYSPGSSAQINVENMGGIDTNYDYQLTLSDTKDVVVNQQSGADTIRNDEVKSISFSIPAGIVTGSYRVSVIVTDKKLNKKQAFEWIVQVTGIGGQVSVTTDKKTYQTDETITVKSTVKPDGILQNAKLSITIYKPEEAFENFPNLSSTASLYSDGNFVYFGTAYNGLYKLDKRTNAFSNYLPNTYVYSVAADTDFIWAATKTGIVRIKKADNTTKSFTLSDVYSLSNDGSFLWVGTWQGFYKFDKLNETFTRWTTQDGLIDNKIYTVAVDGNDVWVGSYDKGLAKYNKLANTFQTVSVQDNNIRDIEVDESAVWVATLAGVAKYDKVTTTWTTFKTENGLAHNWTYSITIDKNFVYIGTWEGLSKYNKNSGEWTTLTTQDGLPSNYVRALAVDEDTIWYGCFTH